MTALLLYILSSSAFAGCIAEHLNDAIALNQKRMPLYAAVSGGTSVPASTALIMSEQLAKFTTRKLDAKAEVYRRKGVGVICGDLLSMDDAPSFVPFTGSLRTNYVRPDVATLKLKLESATTFKEISEESRRFLEYLEQAKPYHCMVSHLVETIERAARNATKHAIAAKRVGMPLSANLSYEFILSMTGTLENAEILDLLSAPAHKMGVPVICRDVPSER